MSRNVFSKIFVQSIYFSLQVINEVLSELPVLVKRNLAFTGSDECTLIPFFLKSLAVIHKPNDNTDTANLTVRRHVDFVTDAQNPVTSRSSHTISITNQTDAKLICYSTKIVGSVHHLMGFTTRTIHVKCNSLSALFSKVCEVFFQCLVIKATTKGCPCRRFVSGWTLKIDYSSLHIRVVNIPEVGKTISILPWFFECDSAFATIVQVLNYVFKLCQIHKLRSIKDLTP